MKCLILLLALLSTSSVSAKQLRVAVVDTGLNVNDTRVSAHICPTGHKNFITGQTLDDVNGHGTFIAGLIEKYAGKSDYCLLIYKYYDVSLPGPVNAKNEVLAIREAVANGADIINISGGGPNFNEDEALQIKYHPEVTFVVAAGNDGKDLDIPGNEYYPASLFYGNMEIVESIDKNGIRSTFSNYGKKVENKEPGEYIHSILPNGRMGWMQGTSMSTAIYTGKLIRKTLDAK